VRQINKARSGLALSILWRDRGQESQPIVPELAPTASGHAPPQAIRARLNLSRAAFAGLMGVSVRTVQDWEQGRREPSEPAKTLLRIAEQPPEVFAQLA
jgi:DNA-binding transcriptional regulator YiaG